MRSVEWHNGKVRMIDQRLLPAEFRLVEYEDYRGVAQAIRTMVIRGAPAIGAAAALGMALAARESRAKDRDGLLFAKPFLHNLNEGILSLRIA